MNLGKVMFAPIWFYLPLFVPKICVHILLIDQSAVIHQSESNVDLVS